MSTEKNNIIDIIFVLDKSGSMSDLTEDTIGGFNSMIKQQKQDNEDDTIFVTTVLFNNEVQLLHDRVLLEEVENLTKKDYVAMGSTSLYDAVGYAIAKADQRMFTLKQKPYKTLMIITTDGYENSSVEFKHSQIKKLITQKREQGWDFLFMGANIEVKDFAENIGLERASACAYRANSSGVSAMYKTVSSFIIDKKHKR